MNRKNLTALLIACLIGMVSAAGIVGSAQAMDSCFTGSWYDPVIDDGRGIDIQALESGVVAGYFYTWHGESRELYALLGGSDADGISLDGYQSLIDGSYWVGDAEIEVVDNDTLIFSHLWRHDFHNTLNTMRWCSSSCDAVYTYKRLTQPIPCN